MEASLEQTSGISAGSANIRLRVSERLAFISGSMGRSLMGSVMTAFLLVFYTDVFGISPAAAGTLFLVARLVDGISDPLSGYLIDRLPRTRWGKFRPLMLVGVVLAGLVFVALFAAPQLSTTGKLIYAYVTYLLYGLVQDLMQIPGQAMMVSMTTHTQERNVLSSFGAAMGVLGYVLPAVITLSLVARFSTPIQGWRTASVIYAVLAAVLVAIMVAGVRERVQPPKERNYSLKDLGSLILGNRPLLILLGAFVCSNLSVSLISPTAVLFFKYNVGRPELFGLTTLVTTGFMMIAMILFPTFAKRLGRRKTYILFGLIGLFGNVALFFVPVSNIPLIFVFSIILALGMGPSGALNQAMLADTVDYTEYKTGKRSEGVIFATLSFCTKLVSGLSGAITGYVLALTGYVPNATQQTRAALLGITSVKHLIVGLFVLAAALLVATYPLTEERYAKIVEELATRKKASGAI